MEDTNMNPLDPAPTPADPNAVPAPEAAPAAPAPEVVPAQAATPAEPAKCPKCGGDMTEGHVCPVSAPAAPEAPAPAQSIQEKGRGNKKTILWVAIAIVAIAAFALLMF